VGPYVADRKPANNYSDQSGNYAKDYSRPYEEHNAPTEKPKRRGLCGLSLVVTWCIAVGIFLVIAGAVAGGVVGGLKSHNTTTVNDGGGGNGSSGTSNSTTGPTTGPLANSELAALNWTDSTSTERRAVFYQKNGALFLSQYFTGNKTWSSFNISALFKDSTTPLNVKVGTPLAVGGWSTNVYDAATGTTGENFLIGLYFLDIENYITELNSRDEDLLVWSQGDVRANSILTADNSRLAAIGHVCRNCQNVLAVGYQDADRVATWTNNSDWTSLYPMDQAYPGTGLAAIPFGAADGDFSVANETRFFYDSNGAVEVSIYNKFGFNKGEFLIYYTSSAVDR
jgi:hypothetical protein